MRPTREPQREPQRDQHRPPRRFERPVLDQAIAINGELRVKLLGLNLLPIQVRLLISSKDVAAELGLDWWQKYREATSRRHSTKRQST
ncbi:MAG: gas vesicle protein [Planctomycetota bacterium]|nr:gas vesicle protein [Planctomycetota bacterium]